MKLNCEDKRIFWKFRFFAFFRTQNFTWSYFSGACFDNDDFVYSRPKACFHKELQVGQSAYLVDGTPKNNGLYICETNGQKYATMVSILGTPNFSPIFSTLKNFFQNNESLEKIFDDRISHHVVFLSSNFLVIFQETFSRIFSDVAFASEPPVHVTTAPNAELRCEPADEEFGQVHRVWMVNAVALTGTQTITIISKLLFSHQRFSLHFPRLVTFFRSSKNT